MNVATEYFLLFLAAVWLLQEVAVLAITWGRP